MLYAKRYESLRQALRDVRLQANLNQEDLASLLSRGQSYVSKVERGEQYLDVLEFVLWCEACGSQPSKVIAKI